VTWLLLAVLPAVARDGLSIGVLSHRSKAQTLVNWNYFKRELATRLPGYEVSIVPLAFDEVEAAVHDRQVDFVSVNPFIYVMLESKYGVSRIATRTRSFADHELTRFGGVIFTSADSQVHSMNDLAKIRLAAVDETSLGGYLTACREFRAVGLEQLCRPQQVEFLGSHDAVLQAVLQGRFAAGIVRTGILEAFMAQDAGFVQKIRVIESQRRDAFPQLHSTRLYPEWPIAELAHTPHVMVKQLLLALLQMPEDPATGFGWTIPHNYQPVHALLKELEIGPYHVDPEKQQRIAFYRNIIISLGIGVLVLIAWSLRAYLSRKRAQTLEQRNRVLILDALAEGVYGVDLDGLTTFVNPAVEKLTGWKPEDLLGQHQHSIMHHSRADHSPYPASECPIYDSYRANRVHRGEDDVFWRKDGSSFPVSFTSSPLTDDKGKLLGAVVAFTDITDSKEAEKSLRKAHEELAHKNRLLRELAIRDGLTGIYNRRFFDSQLQADWTRAQRSNLPLSILLCDIDHFKKFNDKYGHAAGDEVLKTVARAMQLFFKRKSDTLARYGGEEFVIILYQAPPDDTLSIANRLCRYIEESCVYQPEDGGAPVPITISIGTATRPAVELEYPATLFDLADAMLYQAKLAGRNRVMQDAGEPTRQVR
jgi:two-component system sensor histidine kinase TtrS